MSVDYNSGWGKATNEVERPVIVADNRIAHLSMELLGYVGRLMSDPRSTGESL